MKLASSPEHPFGNLQSLSQVCELLRGMAVLSDKPK
jgi:hypothetical protein